MIEGLKVTIKGAELVKLCKTRVEHHRKRAKVYAKQKDNLSKAEIEGMGYTNGDPKKVMEERRETHINEATELEFIADHLDKKEDYLLNNSDLHKLGICKSRY